MSRRRLCYCCGNYFAAVTGEQDEWCTRCTEEYEAVRAKMNNACRFKVCTMPMSCERLGKCGREIKLVKA